MSEKKDEIMGHDPLAWIAEEEQLVDAVEEKPVALAETVKVEPESVVEEPEIVDVAELNMAEDEAVVVDSIEAETATVESVHQGDGGLVISLEGDLGIAQVNDLHRRLCAVLETSSEFSLDMSEVSHVDTSTLQLLCAFVKDANKSELKWQWQGIPDCLQQTANVLGLSSDLGLDADGA